MSSSRQKGNLRGRLIDQCESNSFEKIAIDSVSGQSLEFCVLPKHAKLQGHSSPFHTDCKECFAQAQSSLTLSFGGKDDVTLRNTIQSNAEVTQRDQYCRTMVLLLRQGDGIKVVSSLVFGLFEVSSAARYASFVVIYIATPLAYRRKSFGHLLVTKFKEMVAKMMEHPKFDKYIKPVLFTMVMNATGPQNFWSKAGYTEAKKTPRNVTDGEWNNLKEACDYKLKNTALWVTDDMDIKTARIIGQVRKKAFHESPAALNNKLRKSTNSKQVSDRARPQSPSQSQDASSGSSDESSGSGTDDESEHEPDTEPAASAGLKQAKSHRRAASSLDGSQREEGQAGKGKPSKLKRMDEYRQQQEDTQQQEKHTVSKSKVVQLAGHVELSGAARRTAEPTGTRTAAADGNATQKRPATENGNAAPDGVGSAKVSKVLPADVSQQPGKALPTPGLQAAARSGPAGPQGQPQPQGQQHKRLSPIYDSVRSKRVFQRLLLKWHEELGQLSAAQDLALLEPWGKIQDMSITEVFLAASKWFSTHGSASTGDANTETQQPPRHQAGNADEQVTTPPQGAEVTRHALPGPSHASGIADDVALLLQSDQMKEEMKEWAVLRSDHYCMSLEEWYRRGLERGKALALKHQADFHRQDLLGTPAEVLQDLTDMMEAVKIHDGLELPGASQVAPLAVSPNHARQSFQPNSHHHHHGGAGPSAPATAAGGVPGSQAAGNSSEWGVAGDGCLADLLLQSMALPQGGFPAAMQSAPQQGQQQGQPQQPQGDPMQQAVDQMGVPQPFANPHTVKSEQPQQPAPGSMRGNMQQPGPGPGPGPNGQQANGPVWQQQAVYGQPYGTGAPGWMQ